MTTHDPALRHLSSMLCLWLFCGTASCRRGKRCTRDAGGCLARWSPLVPEQARCGALAVVQAGRCRVSDAELRAAAGVEVAALEAWITQAHAAAGDGQPAGNPQS